MSRLTPAPGPDEHAIGPADAPVTLVEYGDFECPYCADVYPVLHEVRRRLRDDLRFVFRHFPVTDRHPHAQLAAEAAEAAGAQGRFWEMHDRLFEGGLRALERDDLVRHARELGLDVARFESELDGGAHRATVEGQRAGGEASGVSGTPAFFVDGERYDGFYDAETLSEALRDAADARRA